MLVLRDEKVLVGPLKASRTMSRVILERWLVQETERERSPKGDLENSGEYYINGNPWHSGQSGSGDWAESKMDKRLRNWMRSTRRIESDGSDFAEGMWEEEVVE
jgi:hypothetical protein